MKLGIFGLKLNGADSSQKERQLKKSCVSFGEQCISKFSSNRVSELHGHTWQIRGCLGRFFPTVPVFTIFGRSGDKSTL